MLPKSRIVLLGCLALATGRAQEHAQVYRLDTADYQINMTVRFFSPYLGTQLSFRRVSNPNESLCYSATGVSDSCLQRFVGALTLVTYQFRSRRKNVAAAASFREVVTVVAQSDELDPRPPYEREVPLDKGEGSDIQAFGYDESPVPESQRAAVRAESRSRMWVLYQQKLFLNGAREPFGVVEWKHTLDRIELVRVCAPLSAEVSCSHSVNGVWNAPSSNEEE
jgi:hypothetical protein